MRLALADLAEQWLARNWRRLTVARRRRLCTVFPNAEFAGECGRSGARQAFTEEANAARISAMELPYNA